MQNLPLRSSPEPVDANPPTNKNGIEPNAASKEPVVSFQRGLAKNKANTRNVPRRYTAEERGKDVNSKFWEAYKEVSNAYDDDFLAPAHDQIGIILTFAGLLSAVISTFIGGMQPNSGDTTNDLLLHLIQITAAGPNTVHDISNLSSSTRPPTAWALTPAYISLALSILAAFGAVVGKQCLYSYETARGRGSLEESGMRRQMKLDGLEYLQLHAWLQAFLVLLQVALLLFSISLCVATWTDPLPTFGFMVCIVAPVALFYAGAIIFMPVWWRDSPIQIPGTQLLRTMCERFLPNKPGTLSLHKSSAVRWVLETSTSPQAVEAAVAMVPLVQWSPNFDASVIFARLRDTFTACRSNEEQYVICGKAMAHFCIQSVKITPELVDKHFWHEEFQPTRSRFIREAFMDCRAAYYQLKETLLNYPIRLKHQASIRTALRTMVVHGMDHRLSRPDNEDLIWKGDMCWSQISGDKPGCQEFDWLVDYLADETGYDKADETCYALLALSAMRGLGSSAKRRSYIMSLIRCMESTRPRRVRHAALRAICEAREELAPIAKDSMPQDVDAKLVDKLAGALLTAVRPNHDQKFNDGGPNAYIRLIFVLTKHHEWCQRLTQDCYSHLPLCISLADEVRRMYDQDVGFYLAVIVGRINPSSKDLPSNLPQGDFWRLIRDTWQHARNCASLRDDDYVDGIPALVTATRINFPGLDNSVLRKDVAKQVQLALDDLQWRKATFVDNGIAQTTVDDAILSVQGYLGLTEDQSAPQKDGGHLGS